MTRTRLRDARAIRDRAAAMYMRKLDGLPTAAIAAEHGLTPRHVRRELAAIPEATRRRIERARRDELLGPGGWRRVL